MSRAPCVFLTFSLIPLFKLDSMVRTPNQGSWTMRLTFFSLRRIQENIRYAPDCILFARMLIQSAA